METYTVQFCASLSNGETIHEGKGQYKRIAGELSPWQKLSQYLVENNLSITSLHLYTPDGRTFNLPSAGRNPRLAIFNTKPASYNFFRKYAISISGRQKGRPEVYAVIEAMFGDCTIQLWVSEHDSRHIWINHIPQ